MSLRVAENRTVFVGNVVVELEVARVGVNAGATVVEVIVPGSDAWICGSG